MTSFSMGFDFEDQHYLAGLFVEALAERACGLPPSERTARLKVASFHHLAHAALVRERKDRGLRPDRDSGRVIELALTSSDFPLLLADLFGKLALPAYTAAPASYRQIARQMALQDFKPTSVLQLGDFPTPMRVGELGEVTHGQLGESAQTMTLASWARIVSISFRVLHNDDVQAFGDLARAAGLRAAEFENELFFAACFTPNSGLGPTQGDGQPFFHSSRSNVAGAGALDLTRLGAARALIKKQTGPGGMKLNADAAVLLVPPDSATLAEETIAKIADGGAQIAAISDASLSSQRFYVVADPRQLAAFGWGYLEGSDGPSIITRKGFVTESLDLRLTLHFAAGALDPRGAATGAGA